MIRTRVAIATVASLLLTGSVTVYALTATSAQGTSVGVATAPADPAPPPGFRERDAHVNGIRVHYVIGGTGPTLVLLHGYPQTSYEWYGVMPELSSRYRVIAPDLRGAGGSSAPADGYDKATMAKDLRALLVSLGRQDNVRIIGHDIGTMVAFAYADDYRNSVKRLVLTEAPQPDDSVYTYPSLTPNGPGFWNFGFFNLQNGLPEDTIDGHEEEWVAGFMDWLTVNKAAITREDTDVYAAALRSDSHLRASFEWFRAFSQDNAKVKAVAQNKLTVPVLAVGAEFSLGSAVAGQATTYATDVEAAVIPNSGHWIWEERPQRAVRIALAFLE